MRFANLAAGGRALVEALSSKRGAPETIVLGIVRGGVPAAVEVAKELALPLELLVMRSLMVRAPQDNARAARVAGTLVVDEEITARLAQREPVFEVFAAEAMEALEKRELLCRGDRPPVDISGKDVILVDNAIRTGATVRASVRAVRSLNARRVTVAVPVSSKDGLAAAQSLADEVVCLDLPEPFGNAAMFYQRFDVPPDDTIEGLLRAVR